MLPAVADDNNGPLPTCVAAPAAGGRLSGRDEQPWLLQVPVNETLQPNRGEERGGMHKEELSCKESSAPTLLSLSQPGNRAPFVMSQKPHSQLPAHHIQSPVAGMWKDL